MAVIIASAAAEEYNVDSDRDMAYSSFIKCLWYKEVVIQAWTVLCRCILRHLGNRCVNINNYMGITQQDR